MDLRRMKMHSCEEPKLYIVLCALNDERSVSYHVFNIKKSSLLEKSLDLELLASVNSDDDIVRWGMCCGAVGSKILLLGGTFRNRYGCFYIPTSDFYELDIYDPEPERKFKLAGRMVGPKDSPFFAGINGAFYVLNGFPRCRSHGFEIYLPEIGPGKYCNKFVELDYVPQINVDEPSYFVFGPRIYASDNGIYHFDVTNIRGKLRLQDFSRFTWEESKGWGSHKTLPFTGSAAFTFHYDTEHPGNGYFFSFSGGKLSVNVIRDWNFKWSSELLEVAPSFYCNACFCSLDGGNFVLIASPSLDMQDELPAPEVVDIYIITFNFEVNVDYCDDVECTPRFDYKFVVLSTMQINPRTLPIGEKEVFQLQAIGCFQM